jgi:hypothetical protein
MTTGLMTARLMTASTVVLALTAGAAFAQTVAEQAADNEVAVTPPSDEQVIVEQETTHMLTRELIGADVMHYEHGNIGTLDALLFDDNDRILGGVVSIGGFLGLGAKEVALSWDEFTVRPEEGIVYVGLTREQLEAAPSFKDRADIRAEEAAQQAQRDLEQQQNTLQSPTLEPNPQLDADETLEDDSMLEEEQEY